jgi:hypothetical protein
VKRANGWVQDQRTVEIAKPVARGAPAGKRDRGLGYQRWLLNADARPGVGTVCGLITQGLRLTQPLLFDKGGYGQLRSMVSAA